MTRPPKHPAPLLLIREAVRSGNFVYTHHAYQRLLERGISRPEVLEILLKGDREEGKDHFDARHQGWNYALRGRTLIGRELRVVVTFAATLLIVTIINLGSAGDPTWTPRS